MFHLLMRRRRRSVAEARAGLRPARDVLTAERDGLAVLLDLKRDVYFGLDEVGTTAWRAIETGTDIDSVVSRVCRDYDAPEAVVHPDIERFIAELRRRHLVVSA